MVQVPDPADGAPEEACDEPGRADRDTPPIPSGTSSPIWSPVAAASPSSPSPCPSVMNRQLEPELQLMVELDQYEDEGEGDWLSSTEVSPAPFEQHPSTWTGVDNSSSLTEGSWLPSGASTPRSHLVDSRAFRDPPKGSVQSRISLELPVAADESHHLQPPEVLSPASSPSSPSGGLSRLAQPSSLPRPSATPKAAAASNSKLPMLCLENSRCNAVADDEARGEEQQQPGGCSDGAAVGQRTVSAATTSLQLRPSRIPRPGNL